MIKKNKENFTLFFSFATPSADLSGLKLGGEEDSMSDLGPLPPPSTASPWSSNLGSVAPHIPYQGGTFAPSSVGIAGGYAQPQAQPAFNYTNESYMFNRDSGSGEAKTRGFLAASIWF